jgi:hypothetical protein
LVALAALAILAVAACGAASTAPTTAANPTAAPGAGTTTTPVPVGEVTPAPAGQPVDLCGLLSAADLKTITGEDYGEGKPDGYGQCFWRVGDTDVNQGDGQVAAAIQDVPLSTVKGMFAGGVDVTVSGRAAVWNPNEGLQTLWVDIGGRTLGLSFDPVGDDGQAIAVKVGEVAIANL